MSGAKKRSVHVSFLGIFLAVLVSSGGGAGDVRAEQPKGVSLKGVPSLKVTVTQTTPDAVNCGVDIKQLLAELRRVLLEGGLTVVDTSDTVATISFMVAHDPERGVCATSSMLGAYRSVTFFDDKAGWLATGHVALWQRAMQSVAGRANNEEAVKKAVQRLGSDLVDSWRQANRSP